MSLGGINDVHWRETYFVLFDSRQRPTLTQAEEALGGLSNRFQLSNLAADDDGRFESITINAPDDRVAIEISYEDGEAVREQVAELVQQLKSEASGDQLTQLAGADARFDVMHFEHATPQSAADGDDDFDELDPSCLLMVVESLVQLTGGLPIDPASGSILP